jgi:hypothetical protein
VSKNKLQVIVVTELGCKFDEGEYLLYITEIMESMIGQHDYGLIKECIENNVEEFQLSDEGATGFILQETGEWEDVHWHKYYEIAERLGPIE